MLLPANGGVSIERAGGSSNLAAVASLCVDAFVDLPTGPASLTMAELVEQWEQQLAGRLERPQHALLIARREEAETPIGCVELGDLEQLDDSKLRICMRNGAPKSISDFERRKLTLSTVSP